MILQLHSFIRRTSGLVLFFIFSAFMLPTEVHAQLGTLFNSSQKLSSSYVKYLYQDHNGFMWVATEDGLNRYDGYSFRRFGAEDGLSYDNINCIIQDKQGNLYVGTASGLYVMSHGKFEKMQVLSTGEEINAYVVRFCIAPDGSVLFSTSGRGVWRVTDTSKAVNVITGTGNTQYCSDMLFDRKGNLWIVSDNHGVVSYCTVRKGNYTKFKCTHIYKVNDGFNIGSLIKDSYDNIFIGTLNGGMYRLNSSHTAFDLIPSTAHSHITSAFLRKDGSILVGTDGNGVYKFNPVANTFVPSTINSHQIDLAKAKVMAIYEDRYNNLWLGLLQKGVYFQPPHSKVFGCLGEKQENGSLIGNSCVMAVYRQRNGTLWVSGDHDGIYSLDKNFNLMHHFAPTNAGGSMPAAVVTIDENIDGRLWVGSYMEGFGWIDTATGSYHRVILPGETPQHVFDIKHDMAGNLWLGTLGDGLKCYNPKTQQVTTFKADAQKTSLCNDYIIQLAFSKDHNRLYAGTASGLACYDLKKKSWTSAFHKNVLFSSMAVDAICDDGRGHIWVGTPNGLKCVDLKTLEIREYGPKDGLPDKHVSSIEEDNNHMLWISTSNGLCRFDPKTRKVVSYYASDGLQGNEYGSGTSFYDRSAGMMFFGGISGVSYFNPAKANTERRHLKVTLTEMLVGGQLVNSSMKSGRFTICDDAVPESSRFDFCSDDNSITLRFSTLTFTSTERLSYAYSINGDDWIMMSPNDNTLTLSRMPAGDYKFRVKAIDNGVESEVKEFLVVIHNPWYFTPVMRILYLLLIIGAVYWYIHQLRERNRQKLVLQAHKHNEELNEQKLRFFINMSHEIRTPMTLIVSPLLQLMREDQDAHRQSSYEVMKRNAARILHIVNQILDLRKIDKGQMKMQMQETDMVGFVDDVLKLFRTQATSKKIDLDFVHPESSVCAWIDRSHFDTVVVNLMSNAMKYTSLGGKIRVTLEEDTPAGELRLRVFDDGEKIPEDSLDRIFDRFQQVSSMTNRSKTGTGVGLDLTRSLVQLHHGTISASNLDDGVEFVVTLLLGSAHIADDEKAITDAVMDDQKTDALELDFSADVNEEADTQIEEVMNKTNSKRPVVVIVEDDDDIRNYLMTQLAPTYRVLSFVDGAEALPAILREVPQLIISDVMMPRMDGNTLCARVKSNVNTNHIPVILLTAKTRDEDRLESLETGADLYVTKPFNLDILRRNIANLISSRRLMQNKFTGKEDMKGQIDDVELESADEKLLNRILAVVNDNLGNSDLNIDMLCTEVGISRVHLHRKMKEMTNQTPHDFIRNLRLKQAARLLSHKGQSVTQVMYRCGFNSATSFSTMFKKMYGVSPREYARNAQNDSMEDTAEA